MTAKIVALVIALVVVLMGGAIIKNKVPLTERPGLVKRLTIYLTRNTARTRTDHELPELRSRVYSAPPVRVLELAARAAETAGWTPLEVDAARYALHAVVATPWLRFKDDVHVILKEVQDDRTLVEIESRSRIGRADYGANIAHVMELHRRLDALCDFSRETNTSVDRLCP